MKRRTIQLREGEGRRVLMKIKLPPTRNHHQLAAWVNGHNTFDEFGNRVYATVDTWRSNTDTKIGRLRIPGKGRKGLRLRIVVDARLLYSHVSSDTYRKHSEARQWIENNLRMTKLNPRPRKKT